jgi:hypothetical protein
MGLDGQDLSQVQRDFLAYWRRQAANRIAPGRRDLDVLDVPLLMPHVSYFDVMRDPVDFRHRLMGTAVCANFAGDYTGMKMSEIDGRGPGSMIWSYLDEVRMKRSPTFRQVPYVGPKKDFLALKNLFLPTVDEAGETDMIVLVAQFVPK